LNLRALGVAWLAVLMTACSAAPPTPSSSVSSDTPQPTSAPATPGSATNPPSTTDAPTTTPVAPQPESPTSAELILADLDAGRIDQPTALLYRVFAMFGDARLPAGYATDGWQEDGAAIALATDQLDTLPAEIASEVRPFLARPTDPQSVFNQAQTGRLLTRQGTASAAYGAAFNQLGNPYGPADFVCEQSGWGHIDGGTLLNGPAWKIWTVCGDQTAIGQVVELAGWMQRFFTDEVALMGPPVPDGGGPGEAGDGAIDIYLVDQCVSTAGRCLSGGFSSDLNEFGFANWAQPCTAVGAADKCSGYAVIRRTGFSSDTPSTLAHEFFHILEFAHNRRGLVEGGRWNWFAEASAKWAQFRYHSNSRPRRVYPFFDSFGGTGLGLTATNGYNEYVSFVWPLFMQESGPAGEDLIGQAWTAIGGKSGNSAVNAAIGSVVPFTTKFRDFAVTAWNEPLTPAPDPVDPHLWDLDGGLSKAPPYGSKYRLDDLPANPRGAAPLRISVSMPPLSARYTDLLPVKEVQQVTVDFSNVSPAADFDVDALLDIKDKGWERRPLDKGSTRFCLSEPNDAVQELIIVLANHEFEPSHDVTGYWTVESLKEPCQGWDVNIAWTDVYDNVADTIIFKGVVDTVEDNQLGDQVYMTGVGTASGSRAGWKGCNPGIDVTPSGTVSATFQAIIIGDRITISAFADVFTELSGISTAPMEVDVFGGTATYGNVPPPPGYTPPPGATPTPTPLIIGDLCPRYSYGTMTVTPISTSAQP
jgi:hypothetical protein